MQILQLMYYWTRKTPLYFWSHPDKIRPGRGMLCRVLSLYRVKWRSSVCATLPHGAAPIFFFPPLYCVL